MIFSVETELEFLLRIVLSIICGAGIGFERETRLKTAGIRTHIIVSLGSALMMIISKYGFGDVLQSSNIGLDPSRIAAGIVTAVGFIGAGVIFVRNQTCLLYTSFINKLCRYCLVLQYRPKSYKNSLSFHL